MFSCWEGRKEKEGATTLIAELSRAATVSCSHLYRSCADPGPRFLQSAPFVAVSTHVIKEHLDNV